MPRYTRQKIKEIAVEIVAKELLFDAEEVKIEATFSDQGGDSLDQVEIITELEEEFGIEISDENAEKIQTTDQAIEYVYGVIGK